MKYFGSVYFAVSKRSAETILPFNPYLTLSTYNAELTFKIMCKDEMQNHEAFLIFMSGHVREQEWFHQCLSLAVVRANAASILDCVQV